MSQSLPGNDPYEIVLDDLRKQRDKIDTAIQAIQVVRGMLPQTIAMKGASASAVIGTIAADVDLPRGADDGAPKRFAGLSISEAAKKILADNPNQKMSSAEIGVALQAGNFPMTTNDPANTVASVLTRRFNNVGDIIRVSRGQWGLAEWYPDTHFVRMPDEPDRPINQTSAESAGASNAAVNNGNVSSARAISPYHGRIEE